MPSLSFSSAARWVRDRLCAAQSARQGVTYRVRFTDDAARTNGFLGASPRGDARGFAWAMDMGAGADGAFTFGADRWRQAAAAIKGTHAAKIVAVAPDGAEHALTPADFVRKGFSAEMARGRAAPEQAPGAAAPEPI